MLPPQEKRQAELDLLAELLNREQTRLAGARTFTQTEMETMAEELLGDG